MNIINDLHAGDYHVHSSNFSDGLNTIDDIVIQAGKLNYREVAITDHSRVYMDAYGFGRNTHYVLISLGRWQNIHNDVKVRFGVEADLLNEDGEICSDIQGFEPDFIILSTHLKVYSGNINYLKQAYLNAISRHAPKINLLGHLCAKSLSDYLDSEDISAIVKAANSAGISLELNCANLMTGQTSLKNLTTLLHQCDSLYVNSDAHTLSDLIHLRSNGFNFIKKQGGGEP